MTTYSVLTIVGSVRAGSWNHRLAQAAAALAPDELELDIVRSDLPVYDADADASQPGPGVEQLRATADAVDAIIVVTPEYNHAMPGPLKNTLDWLSRPAYRSPLRDKPVTAFGAGPGAGSPGRALAQLTQFYGAVAAAPLPWPPLALSAVAEVLDDQQVLAGPIADRLTAQLEAFVHWIEAVSAYRDRA